MGYHKKAAKKATPERLRPAPVRRMECASCDKYAVCTDNHGAWLCAACAPIVKVR